MGAKTTHVAFKLEAPLAEMLELRARAENAESVGLYAKHLVTLALDQDSELARLRDQVETLAETLADLREALRNSMKALLVAATGKHQVTPQQAEEWAQLHFPDAEPTQ